jgi:heptosyltransferase-1
VRILIVRVSSLGDIVHTFPMVSDIVKHCPNAKIDWLVEEAYVDLVRLHPGVGRIIPVALRRWRKQLFQAKTYREMRDFYHALRQENYDVILDPQGLIKTGFLMYLAKTALKGKRVGLANATLGSGYEGVSRIFHTMSVSVDVYTPAVERSRRVAGAALSYVFSDQICFALKAPSLLLEFLPKEPYAVFFFATARLSKQWRDDSWVELAKMLHQKGMVVLLPWGSEKEKVQAYQLKAKIPNASVLPKLSMLEAIVVAQRASLVVGVDTGLMHVAAAFSRPTVALYCDSPRWKTQATWSTWVLNLGDEGNPPTLEEVSEAVLNVLNLDSGGGIHEGVRGVCE